MIVGVGVDIVDIARFTRALERTPKLGLRLFTDAERELPAASLAGRFAAKEALIKAFGGSGSMTFHDMVVVKDELGKPSFDLQGAAAEMAAARGVASLHLSISHDANAAIAFVVAEAALNLEGLS